MANENLDQLFAEHASATTVLQVAHQARQRSAEGRILNTARIRIRSSSPSSRDCDSRGLMQTSEGIFLRPSAQSVDNSLGPKRETGDYSSERTCANVVEPLYRELKKRDVKGLLNMYWIAWKESFSTRVRTWDESPALRHPPAEPLLGAKRHGWEWEPDRLD